MKVAKDSLYISQAPCGRENQEAIVRYYDECRSITWTCGCYEVDDLSGGYEQSCDASLDQAPQVG
jgi:hypothetical protein